MMRLLATAFLACTALVLALPAHAQSRSADCVNVMGVSGFECVSREQRSGAPQTRHFGVYTKAPKSWAGGSPSWLRRAQQYVGRGNPTSRRSLWCARFVNDRLRESGLRGTGSDLAKSFTRFPRTSARPGAIAIYDRKGGGHVAIVKHVEGNQVTLVSGNCGRSGVCEYTRSLGQAIYVWPS